MICEYCGKPLARWKEPAPDDGYSIEMEECRNPSCMEGYKECPYCLEGSLRAIQEDHFECNTCGRHFDSEHILLEGNDLLSKEEIDSWIHRANCKSLVEDPLEFLAVDVFVRSLCAYQVGKGVSHEKPS